MMANWTRSPIMNMKVSVSCERLALIRIKDKIITCQSEGEGREEG